MQERQGTESLNGLIHMHALSMRHVEEDQFMSTRVFAAIVQTPERKAAGSIGVRTQCPPDSSPLLLLEIVCINTTALQ